MSNYKDYLDRLIPFAELYIWPLHGAENGNGDGDDGANYGEEGIELPADCIRKMRQPISFADHYYPRGAETRKNLIELAWSLDPALWEVAGEWSDADIAKMKEPVYEGWKIHLSPASIKRLTELC